MCNYAMHRGVAPHNFSNAVVVVGVGGGGGSGSACAESDFIELHSYVFQA